MRKLNLRNYPDALTSMEMSYLNKVLREEEITKSYKKLRDDRLE